MTKWTSPPAVDERMEAIVPSNQVAQPNWLCRLWRRVRSPDNWTIRYFVSYDYYWKEYANGVKMLAMGHCVLDVQGGIDTWEKVCSIQKWITGNVTQNTTCPIVTELRINNFIEIKRWIT